MSISSYKEQYTLDKTNITPFIQSQIPEWYFDDDTLWPEFIEAYYEWMASVGNIGYQIKTLFDTRQGESVDLSLIKELFLRDIDPGSFNSPGNIRLALKHIIEVYTLKGSPASFEVVFSILYNSNVQIEQPGYKILKASDGNWKQLSYIEVMSDITGSPLDIAATLKTYLYSQIIGRVSGARAIIEDMNINYIQNKIIPTFTISNLNGEFSVGEQLLVNNNLIPVYVRGSLSYILITEGGTDFNVSDQLNVKSITGVDGVAEVLTTGAQSGTVNFNIVNGGYGYTANAIVTLTNIGNNNIGTGANFKIGSLANTAYYTVNLDTIQPAVSIALNSTYTNFTANPTANLNTIISNALNNEQLLIGSISSLSNIDPGSNYTAGVNVTITEPLIVQQAIFDVNGGIWGADAIIVTGNASIAQNTVQTLKIAASGLGYIANELVELTNSNNNTIVYGYTGLTGVGTTEGRWQNTSGLISSTQMLQDSSYYQDFSYVISSNVIPAQYNSFVEHNLHPVGFERYSKFSVNDTVTKGATVMSVTVTH